ncbi:unnamed protein product, partial [Timema podura]|nr:unnamed protein product [Timema podura]
MWFIQSLLQRGLSRSKIALKHVSLSALVTLAIRPLVSAGFTEKLMTMFVIHILSVPALVLHVQNLAPEVFGGAGSEKPSATCSFPPPNGLYYSSRSTVLGSASPSPPAARVAHSRPRHTSLQAPTTYRPTSIIGDDSVISSFKFLNLFVLTNAPLMVLKRSKGTDKCIQVFVNHNILTKSLELLNSEQNIRIVFNTLEGNYALCLVGNLVHLAYIQKDDSLKEVFFPTFTFVISRMLESCQNYVVSKQSNLTYWHPVLGWFAQNMDYGLHEAMPSVKVQLYMLWSGCVVNVILG